MDGASFGGFPTPSSSNLPGQTRIRLRCPSVSRSRSRSAESLYPYQNFPTEPSRALLVRARFPTRSTSSNIGLSQSQFAPTGFMPWVCSSTSCMLNDDQGLRSVSSDVPPQGAVRIRVRTPARPLPIRPTPPPVARSSSLIRMVAESSSEDSVIHGAVEVCGPGLKYIPNARSPKRVKFEGWSSTNSEGDVYQFEVFSEDAVPGVNPRSSAECISRPVLPDSASGVILNATRANSPSGSTSVIISGSPAGSPPGSATQLIQRSSKLSVSRSTPSPPPTPENVGAMATMTVPSYSRPYVANMKPFGGKLDPDRFYEMLEGFQRRAYLPAVREGTASLEMVMSSESLSGGGAPRQTSYHCKYRSDCNDAVRRALHSQQHGSIPGLLDRKNPPVRIVLSSELLSEKNTPSRTASMPSSSDVTVSKFQYGFGDETQRRSFPGYRGCVKHKRSTVAPGMQGKTLPPLNVSVSSESVTKVHGPGREVLVPRSKEISAKYQYDFGDAVRGTSYITSELSGFKQNRPRSVPQDQGGAPLRVVLSSESLGGKYKPRRAAKSKNKIAFAKYQYGLEADVVRRSSSQGSGSGSTRVSSRVSSSEMPRKKYRKRGADFAPTDDSEVVVKCQYSSDNPISQRPPSFRYQASRSRGSRSQGSTPQRSRSQASGRIKDHSSRSSSRSKISAASWSGSSPPLPPSPPAFMPPISPTPSKGARTIVMFTPPTVQESPSKTAITVAAASPPRQLSAVRRGSDSSSVRSSDYRGSGSDGLTRRGRTHRTSRVAVRRDSSSDHRHSGVERSGIRDDRNARVPGRNDSVLDIKYRGTLQKDSSLSLKEPKDRPSVGSLPDRKASGLEYTMTMDYGTDHEDCRICRTIRLSKEQTDCAYDRRNDSPYRKQGREGYSPVTQGVTLCISDDSIGRRKQSPSPLPVSPRRSDLTLECRTYGLGSTCQIPGPSGYNPSGYSNATIQTSTGCLTGTILQQPEAALTQQPCEDSAFRIRIRGRKRKTKPEACGSDQAVGDVPQAEKDIKFKRERTTHLQRRFTVVPTRSVQQSRPLAKNFNAYMYLVYESDVTREKRARSQEHAFSPSLARCEKPRKSISLDAITTRIEDAYANPQKSATQTTEGPSSFSSSCVLTGFGSLEGMSLLKDPDQRPVTDSVTYMHPSESGSPVRQIQLLKRILPVLALMPIVVALAFMFSFISGNAVVQAPLAAVFNDTHYSLGEESPAVRDIPLKSEVSVRTCNTVPCRRDGVYLKNLLSWNLDPCDDFYQFVCTRWNSTVTEAVAKGGDSAASAYGDLTHQLETQVLNLMQQPQNHEELAQLKGIFLECMNTNKQNQNWSHISELLWLVTLDGFPFDAPPTNGTSVWVAAARLLAVAGVQTLVDIRTVSHPFKSNESVISIGVPQPLSPSPGNVTKTINFYNRSASAAVAILDKRLNSSAISEKVADFAAQHEFLAFNHTNFHCTRSLGTLENHPDLLLFVTEVSVPERSPGPRAEVLFECQNYIDNLSHLISSFESSVILNYFGVRTLIEMAAFTPQEGQQLLQALVTHLYNRPPPVLPRWKLCMRMAERALPQLFLYAVRLVHETRSVLHTILRHTSALVQQLEVSLGKLTVLDRGSMMQAKIMLNRTKIFYFYPSWLEHKEKFREYIDELPSVTQGQGLLSYYTLRGHSFSTSLREDGHHPWFGSAFDTDCSFDGHAIYLPLLMFNMTLVRFEGGDDLLLPHAGSRITRCLLHVLLSNIDFNVRNTLNNWWPDLGHSLLSSSQLCFEQYCNVSEPLSMKVLESTASLKPTLDLYLQRSRLNSGFTQLEAFRAQHLFFAYHVLGYCEKHASTSVRHVVNVPLWNSRAFQETFRCPVGSRMNPARKCLLWKG